MPLANVTKRVLAGAALAAFTAVSGLGMATAHADTRAPRHWCPGDPKQGLAIPSQFVDWDWSICHTWYETNYGMGNLTAQGRPISAWDGDNPPIEAITVRQCPPISFMCP